MLAYFLLCQAQFKPWQVNPALSLASLDSWWLTNYAYLLAQPAILAYSLASQLALVYQLKLDFKFHYFPGWVVGGWVVGGVKLKLKLNSAQLKLELGLSLAKMPLRVDTSFRDSARKPLGPKDR